MIIQTQIVTIHAAMHKGNMISTALTQPGNLHVTILISLVTFLY